MSYNSGTGAISDGNKKAYVSFNYSASASSLTDAPSFSQWTQYPAATSGGTATYSISSSDDKIAQTKLLYDYPARQRASLDDARR